MLSSCDYRFEPGHTYLVYATQTEDGRWTTNKCSGTTPIDRAQPDLAYIRSIDPDRTAGRLYGQASRIWVDPASEANRRTELVEGLTLTAVSERELLAFQTDALGQFDVDLPGGDYTLQLALPETMRVYGSRSVTVPARGCAARNFSFEVDGRVSGQVVQADGQPARHTWVSMVEQTVPIPDVDAVAPVFTAKTDLMGHFTIDTLPPGRYHLAVNATRGPSRDAPYVTTYWPGTVDRDDAGIVVLDEGERREDMRLVVSPITPTTLSGIVRLDDGTPVGQERVQFYVPNNARHAVARATTADDGTFRVDVYPGFTYILRVTVRIDRRMRRGEDEVAVDGPTVGVVLVVPSR